MVLYLSFSVHTTTETAYNPISPTKYSSYYNIFFKTAAIFFSNIIAVLVVACESLKCSVYIEADNERCTMLKSFISSYSVTCDYFELILGVVGSLTKRDTTPDCLITPGCELNEFKSLHQKYVRNRHCIVKE